MSKNHTKGDNTKEKIYEEAFKLFMSKPYELVTVRDIEKVIGKTRGAIFYHVKDKHDLFQKVIENYFLKHQNIYEVLGKDILEKDMTFLDFIDIYISMEGERLSNLYAFLGVDENNADKKVFAKTNCSYLGLLFNTGYYLDDYNEKMEENYRMDKNTWSFFIQKAIERGEVKPNTNVKLFGEIFSSIYLGKAFVDAFSTGVDAQGAKQLFIELYNKIKV